MTNIDNLSAANRSVIAYILIAFAIWGAIKLAGFGCDILSNRFESMVSPIAVSAELLAAAQ